MRQAFVRTRPFVPVADFAYEQLESYQRVGVFVLGCIEREHLLNVDALAQYWLRLGAAWPNPMTAHPPMATAPRSDADRQLPQLCKHRLPASSCPA